MTQVALLGGGGHAKVVYATLIRAGWAVACCFDDALADQALHPALGVPIAGRIDDAAGWRGPAVLAIGDNAARAAIAARLGSLAWLSVAHPRAVVEAGAQLEPGAVVFAGAVIQPGAVIGAHAIVNTGASVDHDACVGELAHVGPGARLCGAVQVGRGALIGVGASVAPGVAIGAWTIVGAGAAVVRDLPERVTAVGVPARPRPEGSP